MIKKNQEIQVTNLLNELMPVTKVIHGLAVTSIPKYRASGSLGYRLSHPAVHANGVQVQVRKGENFLAQAGGPELTKLRHNFQVTHLHHSTQQSAFYTDQKFVIA